MKSNEQTLVAFEKHAIRRFYDEKNEMWYFSVIDVVAALTDSVNPRDYWFKMKIRVKTEDGLELSTICRPVQNEGTRRQDAGNRCGQCGRTCFGLFNPSHRPKQNRSNSGWPRLVMSAFRI